jgi:hypothetical protein
MKIFECRIVKRDFHSFVVVCVLFYSSSIIVWNRKSSTSYRQNKIDDSHEYYHKTVYLKRESNSSQQIYIYISKRLPFIKYFNAKIVFSQLSF